MLSAEFGTIPVNEVYIDRSKRIRREVKEEAIEDLMGSLQRIGQLHPIVIKRDGELVAGETRWTAACRLGWTAINFQYADTLDEDELLAIELEENVKRSDLPWQDQCSALQRFHELQLRRNTGWTLEKTAEAIGYTVRHVHTQLGIAQEIAAGNERVAQAPKMSVAKGIIKRKTERARHDELANLAAAIPGAPEPKVSPILTEDFNQWAAEYTGPSFNLVHCDFPYGINADKFDQGAAAGRGGYADDFQTYTRLCETLVEHKDKLLGQSAHVIFWFSMKHYAWTLAFLQEHFWVDPYPLIWFKSDNKGTLPDPQRGPRRVYEAAFLCSHGDRKIVSAVANTFAAPTVRLGEHMSEKNADMLAHFFRMVVDDSTRLLDPTCGSGSALRAAAKLGAKSVLGLEVNPEFADNARMAWEKAQ